MKSKKMEYGSKGVMGGHGSVKSRSGGVVADRTRIKHRYEKGTLYKEATNVGNTEPTKRNLEPICGVERELPRRGPEMGRSGQRRAGMRVNLGKGGQEMGKRTGLAHIAPTLTRLGPDYSTQVVDFPHIEDARLSWVRPEMVRHGRNTEKTRMPKRPSTGGSEGNRARVELRELHETMKGGTLTRIELKRMNAALREGEESHGLRMVALLQAPGRCCRGRRWEASRIVLAGWTGRDHVSCGLGN